MTKQTEAQRLADQMLHYWDERGPDAEAVAAKLRRLDAVNAQLLEALKRISLVKPDQLDHGIDVVIIQRCANVARDAIAAARNIQ